MTDNKKYSPYKIAGYTIVKDCDYVSKKAINFLNNYIDHLSRKIDDDRKSSNLTIENLRLMTKDYADYIRSSDKQRKRDARITIILAVLMFLLGYSL